MYDWLISLSREWLLFFSGNAGLLSSLLYFTNRYINLFSTIMFFVPSGQLSDEVCVFNQFEKLIADPMSTRSMLLTCNTVQRGIYFQLELTPRLLSCRRLIMSLDFLGCFSMIPYLCKCLEIQKPGVSYCISVYNCSIQRLAGIRTQQFLASCNFIWCPLFGTHSYHNGQFFAPYTTHSDQLADAIPIRRLGDAGIEISPRRMQLYHLCISPISRAHVRFPVSTYRIIFYLTIAKGVGS